MKWKIQEFSIPLKTSWDDCGQSRNYSEEKQEKIQTVLSRRDLQNKLPAEFEKSLEKFTPSGRKIDMTDPLTDQIVYRLYELAEEEIEIRPK